MTRKRKKLKFAGPVDVKTIARLTRDMTAYRSESMKARRQQREAAFGTLGPASPVRRIDPLTGRVINET
jgi:hypothetical protein